MYKIYFHCINFVLFYVKHQTRSIDFWRNKFLLMILFWNKETNLKLWNKFEMIEMKFEMICVYKLKKKMKVCKKKYIQVEQSILKFLFHLTLSTRLSVITDTCQAH